MNYWAPLEEIVPELEPVAYDSMGAPLYAHQIEDDPRGSE
jgi:hypothetical protein